MLNFLFPDKLSRFLGGEMYSGIFMYSVLPTYLRLGGKGVKDSIYNFFSLNKEEEKISFGFLLNIYFAITQLTLRVKWW